MRTRCLTGLDGLHALRDSWLSLHADADLYARYEWQQALATHLVTDPAALAYLEVLEGERTVAIVPLHAGVAAIPLFGRRRVLSLGLHSNLSLADFPLAADADPAEIATALGAALADWPEPWEALFWPRVLASSNAVRVARALRSPAVHLLDDQACNTMDVRRTFAALLAGISGKQRASLRKAQRRLAESGGGRFTRNGIATAGGDWRNAGGAEIEAAYEAFLAVEASGWKGAAGTGSAIRLEAGRRGFYAELLARRSADFVPEVTLLWHGDRPIGGQLAVTVNGCQHFLKIGYDESAAAFTPGLLVHARMLENACEDGLDRVSFVTDLPWHQSWRPEPIAAFKMVAFRRAWQSMLYDSYQAARRTAGPMLQGWQQWRERRAAPSEQPAEPK